MVRTVLLALACVGSVRADDPVDANPVERAEAAPSRINAPKIDRPLAEYLSALDERDPVLREGARETLMLLERKDLPRLLSAAHEAMPLTTMQRSALRDIVLHVYLTEVHGFKGDGAGFIGISGPMDIGEPAIIQGRTMGFDGYRVLRDGDTVVGMQVAPRPMQPVANFNDLRNIVLATRPGNWILVRVIRNGQPVEVLLHLTARIEQPGMAVGGVSPNLNPLLPQAQAYWDRTFAPALDQPSTRPAS